MESSKPVKLVMMAIQVQVMAVMIFVRMKTSALLMVADQLIQNGVSQNNNDQLDLQHQVKLL